MTDDQSNSGKKERDDDEVFSEFDDIGDRDGDPFDALNLSNETVDGASPDEAVTPDSPDYGHSDSGDSQDFDFSQPSDKVEEEHRSVTGPSDMAASGVDSEDNFAGDTPGEDDPFGAESPFEKVETENIDEDALWEEIQSDEPDSAEEDATDAASLVGEVVVSKSRFCQQCEYFSEPPDIGCDHDGTEIIEFVGINDIRISNCPVVAKERELGHDIN